MTSSRTTRAAARTSTSINHVALPLQHCLTRAAAPNLQAKARFISVGIMHASTPLQRPLHSPMLSGGQSASKSTRTDCQFQSHHFRGTHACETSGVTLSCRCNPRSCKLVLVQVFGARLAQCYGQPPPSHQTTSHARAATLTCNQRRMRARCSRPKRPRCRASGATDGGMA